MATATAARKRKPVPRPHRPLALTAPYTRGSDVKRLQAKLKVTPDGVYGPQTQRALRRKLWTLGCATTNLDAGATVTYQRIILGQQPRPTTWVKEARSRAKMAAAAGHEVDAVLAWAESKVGIHETGSYNSNRGKEIDVWQREVGMLAQPWCGAFVIYGLRHVAHIVVPDSWRFTPNVLSDARSGQYGFHFTTTPTRGALCLMDFKAGGDPVMHVGYCLGGYANIEGNTSSDDSKSQDEGGEVAHKTRNSGVVVGYAVPPYGA